jgi:hypothetical protein
LYHSTVLFVVIFNSVTTKQSQQSCWGNIIVTDLFHAVDRDYDMMTSDCRQYGSSARGVYSSDYENQGHCFNRSAYIIYTSSSSSTSFALCYYLRIFFLHILLSPSFIIYPSFFLIHLLPIPPHTLLFIVVPSYIPSSYSSLALQPGVGFSLLHNTPPFGGSSEGFVTIILFWCGVVSPTSNPQPGGPHFSCLSLIIIILNLSSTSCPSSSSPSTCVNSRFLPLHHSFLRLLLLLRILSYKVLIVFVS